VLTQQEIATILPDGFLRAIMSANLPLFQVLINYMDCYGDRRILAGALIDFIKMKVNSRNNIQIHTDMVRLLLQKLFVNPTFSISDVHERMEGTAFHHHVESRPLWGGNSQLSASIFREPVSLFREPLHREQVEVSLIQLSPEELSVVLPQELANIIASAHFGYFEIFIKYLVHCNNGSEIRDALVKQIAGYIREYRKNIESDPKNPFFREMIVLYAEMESRLRSINLTESWSAYVDDVLRSNTPQLHEEQPWF